MNFTLSHLVRRAIATVFNPREEAEAILAIGIPREAGWPLLALITILSVIVGKGTEILFQAAGLPLVVSPVDGTFALAIVQVSLAVIMVFAIYWGGRAFGGTGAFGEVVILVAWMQFVLFCIQILQLAALFLLPVLIRYLLLLGVGLFFWLMTNFVAVVHGFTSTGRVFVGILGSMFAIFFVITAILTMIGFQIPQVPADV